MQWGCDSPEFPEESSGHSWQDYLTMVKGIPSLFGWRQATSCLTSPPPLLRHGDEGGQDVGAEEGTRQLD